MSEHEVPKVGPAVTSVRTEQHNARAYVTGHRVEREPGIKPIWVDEVRVRWERSGSRPWETVLLLMTGDLLNSGGSYVEDEHGDPVRSSISFNELGHAPDWLREWAESMRPETEETQ